MRKPRDNTPLELLVALVGDLEWNIAQPVVAF
jgi:hypothetical protein